MESRQLRYFVAVAEQLSFAGASKSLRIAQSALSVQVSNLEEEVGAKLFVRAGRAVSLTSVGKVMLVEAQRTLRQLDFTLHVGRRAAVGAYGLLRVGYERLLPWYLPGRVLTPFAQRYPHVDVDLTELSSRHQVEALRREDLDVGILIGNPAAVGVDALKIASEAICVVCGPTHPLARREGVSLAELADYPVDFLERSYCEVVHDLVIAGCHQGGFTPRIRYEAPEVRILWGLVTSGRSFTFGYRSFAVANFPGLVGVPILNMRPRCEFFLAWLETRAQLPLVKNFVDEGRTLLEEAGAP